MSLLGKLLGFGRPAPPVEGFVYVPDACDDPMQAAREDAVVRIAGRGPPWIVVDQDPRSIVVARWPGRLWRVRIVEAATARDQRAAGGPPLPYATYTRAIAVRVLREQPAALMFGPHGAAIAPILQAAAQLDAGQAAALAAGRHPDAPAAWDRAWRAWMTAHGIPAERYGDLDGVLKLGGRAERSPLNDGFAVLHTIVFDRARRVGGDAAIVADGDDLFQAAPWDGAAQALADAALALGRPDLVAPADRVALLRAWNQVRG